LLLIAYASDIALVFLGNFFRGISDAIIMASSYAFASILIPAKSRGKLFAIYNASFFLSWGTAGTFLAGPIADILLAAGASEIFAYQMTFILGAGLTFAGLLVLGALLWLKPEEDGHNRGTSTTS